MESYKIETLMTGNGQLTLDGLPFKAGEPVEVIILALPTAQPVQERYPLRGTVVKYDAPFESVAMQDWEAAQ
jgi:hypothetical protein